MDKLVLKIVTIRTLSKEDFDDYKKLYDSHPDTHKIDWGKLETEGRLVDISHLPTEDVTTVYTLWAVSQGEALADAQDSTLRKG